MNNVIKWERSDQPHNAIDCRPAASDLCREAARGSIMCNSATGNAPKSLSFPRLLTERPTLRERITVSVWIDSSANKRAGHRPEERSSRAERCIGRVKYTKLR
ncbi:hypothetical protein ABIA85_004562 [Bradyrhizobium sp. LA6.10]|jgi:hypothetical protein|uniref:hypothetical protein n=1 Tax=Bradyrhizobium sp. LA6.10 TaxID=3156318 RepID=UPI00339211A3